MRSRAALSFGVLVSTLVLAGCGGGAGSAVNNAGSSTASQSSNVVPRVIGASSAQRLAFIPAVSTDVVPAGTPAVINAWVSLSFAISGVPCVNCVGSPAIPGALGIAFPSPYLPLKSTYELTYTFYNVSEGTSSCSLIWSLKQGTTSLLHNVSTIKLNGNGQYVYFIGGPLPSTAIAGLATASANVHCNGFVPKAATQTVYFH